jgi:hypothetical protein
MVKNGLDFFDLMPCLYEPWMAAFSRDGVLAGWKEIGQSPYTSCVSWELWEDEEATAVAKERVVKKLAEAECRAAIAHTLGATLKDATVGEKQQRDGSEADGAMRQQIVVHAVTAGIDPEDAELATEAIKKAVLKAKRQKARVRFSVKSSEVWDQGPITDGNAYEIANERNNNKVAKEVTKLAAAATRAADAKQARAKLMEKGVAAEEALAALGAQPSAVALFGEFSIEQLKGLILLKGDTPTAGLKAVNAEQLAKLLGGGARPTLAPTTSGMGEFWSPQFRPSSTMEPCPM